MVGVRAAADAHMEAAGTSIWPCPGDSRFALAEHATPIVSQCQTNCSGNLAQQQCEFDCSALSPEVG